MSIDPHAYAMAYEFRSDEGDYTPTDGERAMIEDAICGYLALSAPPTDPAPSIDAEAVETKNPMSFFAVNVDRWGALEWFGRLVEAIREQDKAVVAGDDIAFETYRMIAASSAMTLAREHAGEVIAALRPATDRAALNQEQEQ